MGEQSTYLSSISGGDYAMPIDRKQFEKGKPEVKKEWRLYEQLVTVYLEDRFHQEFEKRRITIGKPREFDAVSEDRSILAQVKYTGKALHDFSDQELRHRFEQYMLDALLLERAPGTFKILVLYPEEVREWFVRAAKGLISGDIEVITVPMEG